MADDDVALLKTPLTKANPFIRFATPLAIKPKVISNIGPRPATKPVVFTINCFMPGSSLLNDLSRSVPKLISGVIAFMNSSPTGASSFLKSSIAF